jgi:uncharacterized delta-60 repeat protein
MKKSIAYIFISIVFILNCNAQLYDNTFNGTGVWNAEIRNGFNVLKAIAIQSDGKIVIAGSTADAGASAVRQFMLGRLTTGGVLDNSFGTAGIAEFAFSTDLNNSADNIIVSNGSIYACGFNNNSGVFEALLVKLDNTGNLDATFNGTGKLTETINGSNENIPYSINATSDNKIITIGHSYTSQLHLSGFKVDATGVLDNTFGTNGKIFFNTIGDPIQNSCIQTDNKILLVANGILMRIKTNGNLDSTTFGTNGQVNLSLGLGFIQDVATQKDGKIVLCGRDANNNFVVCRYNTNGTIDATFGTNGTVIVPFAGDANEATAITIDTTSTSGKIFVTGYSAYNSETTEYFALARLNPTDGTVEAHAEFQPNGLNAGGTDIVLQSDGKVVIGGSTSSYSINDFIVTRILPNFATLVATGVLASTEISTGINLFPNPASQNINVHSAYNIEQIKVIDVLGNEVMSVISSGNTQIDISSLPKGLYNFVITTDKGIGNKKVSVQ